MAEESGGGSHGAGERRSYAQIIFATKPPPKLNIGVKPPAFTDAGEPASFFSRDDMHRAAGVLNLCIIVRCSYGRSSIPEIKSCLTQRLGLSADFIVSGLNHRHILFRFDVEADYLKVITRRSLYIKGLLYRFFKWEPNFDFNADPTLLPVWVGFPMLPVHLYLEDCLRTIAGNLGTILRIHEPTLALTQTQEAFVCVELDIKKPRPERIWIGCGSDGFWQTINYHGVPSLCGFCHKLGHEEGECKKKSKPAVEVQPVPVQPVDKPTTAKADGFKEVKAWRPRIAKQQQSVTANRFEVLQSQEDGEALTNDFLDGSSNGDANIGGQENAEGTGTDQVNNPVVGSTSGTAKEGRSAPVDLEDGCDEGSMNSSLQGTVHVENVDGAAGDTSQRPARDGAPANLADLEGDTEEGANNGVHGFTTLVGDDCRAGNLLSKGGDAEGYQIGNSSSGRKGRGSRKNTMARNVDLHGKGSNSGAVRPKELILGMEPAEIRDDSSVPCDTMMAESGLHGKESGTVEVRQKDLLLGVGSAEIHENPPMAGDNVIAGKGVSPTSQGRLIPEGASQQSNEEASKDVVELPSIVEQKDFGVSELDAVHVQGNIMVGMCGGDLPKDTMHSNGSDSPMFGSMFGSDDELPEMVVTDSGKFMEDEPLGSVQKEQDLNVTKGINAVQMRTFKDAALAVGVEAKDGTSSSGSRKMLSRPSRKGGVRICGPVPPTVPSSTVAKVLSVSELAWAENVLMPDFSFACEDSDIHDDEDDVDDDYDDRCRRRPGLRPRGVLRRTHSWDDFSLEF